MTRIHLILLYALTLLSVSSCTKQPQFTMTHETAEPVKGSIIADNVWQTVPTHQTFYAPWSGGKQDDTRFQCYLSDNYFYFKFRVNDQTLTLSDPFTKKLDVCDEDRAEIFISATRDMKTYYCMEIDPNGHALDYVAHYFRQFDYDWSFRTLETETEIGDGNYIVAGRLSTKEISDLGISLDDFYMGAFRADFDTPKNVVWYSLLKTEREKADFHIPEMLFHVNVKR